MNMFKIMIFYIGFCSILFGQTPINDVYILFDENQEEMFTSKKRLNDSILFEHFTVRKYIPTEKYSRTLYYNEFGVIKSGMLGATSSLNGSFKSVKFTNVLNQNIINSNRVLRLKVKGNILKNKLIQDVRFVNFIEILQQSKNIYIIREDKENEQYYLITKVKMKL